MQSPGQLTPSLHGASEYQHLSGIYVCIGHCMLICQSICSMHVVSEIFVMCCCKKTCTSDALLRQQLLLDLFQISEHCIFRDPRLESVATEKEAFFAEVTCGRELYLLSCELLLIFSCFLQSRPRLF